jgi:hypothetical protein
VNPSINNHSFIFDLYQRMKQYTLSYIYRGGVSVELSDKILSLAESNIENSTDSITTKKKVYFIVVESLQNITRHQNKPAQHDIDDASFFVIQRLEKDYYITSGNIVENSNIKLLESNLDKINSLDKDALKAYYQDVLANGELSDKGGAGLGFVEMARKSGNKLAYSFKKINDNYSNFYFQTTVSVPDANGVHQPVSGSMNQEQLNWIENLDRLLAEKNLNLIYELDFTQESLIGLLSMTEGNIGNSKELILRKKIFNITVELLQNICKHADTLDKDKEGKSGIFLIGKEGNDYTLTTGNLILNERKNAIIATIERINKTTVDELNAVYNTIMMIDERKDAKGAGLGFTDMRMKSGNSLFYNFISIDDQYSFFEIQVKITEK